MPIAPQRLPAPTAFGIGAPSGVLLALLVLLTLVAFALVVRQAVRQGEWRRHATEVRDDATWRCKALRERTLRGACLAGLRDVPDGVLQPPS